MSIPAVLKVIIRGYGGGAKIFEEQVEIERAAMDFVVGALADKHLEILSVYERIMLEIEFLDAPEGERFLRFGNDPRLMAVPLKAVFA